MNNQKVNNFVEAVRMENHPNDLVKDQQKRNSMNGAAELQLAQQKAERTIIEAEKFRAVVEQPGTKTSINASENDEDIQGVACMVRQDRLSSFVNVEGVPGPGITNNLLEQNRMPAIGSSVPDDTNVATTGLQFLNIGSGMTDDDFFHLTCHIEPSLIHKIEKGEYVELEKLLPKDKLGKIDESRLEWVQRDRGTFLVPGQKDNKIGNFRKWEQAFRAYATIYCGSNPNRSKEIWQYITVINTVASAYQWDNVYNYDITFRHLMAFNPQRSWAVTYNQMWNLSMRDPLPKSNGYKPYQHHSGSGYVQNQKSWNAWNGNSSRQSSNTKRNKSDYCWNFNKGVPCRFGSKCKFIERYKYCDSPTHGMHACHKLVRKSGNNNNNASGGTSQASDSKKEV